MLACATMLAAHDGSAAPWIIEVRADLPAGIRLAIDDLRADVGHWGGAVSVEEPGPARCVRGELRLAIAAPGPAARGLADDACARAPLDAQEYLIREQRCGSGRRVVLAGGSLLAGQWAVYDLLQRLGIRYFHPEQTYYPPHPAWPAAPIDVREHPAFRDRSMHVHGDHPVDLSPPRALAGLAMADYQRRWIDWNVKLRQSLVDGGFDAALVGTYAYDRGFPRVVGLNLANGQQGGRPVLDLGDPRPEHDQIAAAIDRLLAPAAGLPDASVLTVNFSPSEFTTADEDQTVDRLRFVASYVAARHPAVRLITINHGTHQEPVAKRHVRYFDLPQSAPPAMGVLVHPLMLYDLQRPAAGVYGNADFSHLQRWVRTERAAADRLLPGVVVVADVRPGGAAVSHTGHAGRTAVGSRLARAVARGSRRRDERRRGTSPVHQRARVGLLADRLLRGAHGLGPGVHAEPLPGRLHRAAGWRWRAARGAARGAGTPGARGARSGDPALSRRQRRRHRDRRAYGAALSPAAAGSRRGGRVGRRRDRTLAPPQPAAAGGDRCRVPCVRRSGRSAAAPPIDRAGALGARARRRAARVRAARRARGRGL